MVINSVEIKPGQSRQLSLIISKLPTRTPIDIPVHIFRAKKPGPSILLMAGMHGDEINGVEIIRQMISKKMLKPECGSVVAVPLINIYGFINFSRQVPDGKDVNRSFPGSKTGSLAGRVAHSFMTEIFPQIDFGVDFHTGGGSISNAVTVVVG